MASSDGSSGFSAEEVVAQLGSRRFSAAYEEEYLSPAFDEVSVTWTLASHDVLRGSQSTSCEDPVEGLAVPMTITIANSDDSVVLSRDEYIFAVGLDDTELRWPIGLSIEGEGSAIVPPDYLDHAVSEAGGTLTDTSPAVVVTADVVAPQVGLQYRGTTPEGATVVPVFEATLTPL